MWVTRPESVDLLGHNPYVSRVLVLGSDASLRYLLTRRFDLIVNLDQGATSCELVALTKAKEIMGFVLGHDGAIRATDDPALAWLEMGLFDDLKRANRETYQSIVGAIVGAPSDSLKYVFNLADDERQGARARMRSLGFREGIATVGINPGAGGRWPLKQWRLDGYAELTSRLHHTYGPRIQLVILGGPAERESLAALRSLTDAPLIDTGCDNPVRAFAAMISLCDLIVLGDTLAMHLALALGRRVVVLFGPTSHTEIELYGLGEKVYPEMPCLSCYRQTCDIVPTCMQALGANEVFAAVARQLELTGKGL
ncbi:MAG: glycosyltransferase family 9 protein [Spirochaetes bacterium]|nr:glycosyltransferase family 9 protein [Spirochaetota bacterium]